MWIRLKQVKIKTLVYKCQLWFSLKVLLRVRSWPRQRPLQMHTFLKRLDIALDLLMEEFQHLNTLDKSQMIKFKTCNTLDKNQATKFKTFNTREKSQVKECKLFRLTNNKMSRMITSLRKLERVLFQMIEKNLQMIQDKAQDLTIQSRNLMKGKTLTWPQSKSNQQNYKKPCCSLRANTPHSHQ